jgi:hypothetical protein
MTDRPLIGLAVDLVIALVVVEAIALVVLHRWRGVGPAPYRLLPNLASGLCLMLAVRAALDPTDAIGVALGLAGAGFAHAIDLVRRWPPSGQATR